MINFMTGYCDETESVSQVSGLKINFYFIFCHGE